MSIEAPVKKKLFFVKSPGYATATAETFLKKRNFEVHSETAVKVALAKIFEIQPDFIFFALDHLDPAIESLPKLIAQASVSPVIPYITSSLRTETRKLNMHPAQHKLYPPLSGPAIERLVLKTYKQAAEEEARLNEKDEPAVKEKPLQNDKEKVKQKGYTYIKSGFNKKLVDPSNPNNNDTIELEDTIDYSDHEEQQKVIRHQSIHLRNNILKSTQKQKLTNDKIQNLKNSLNSMVKEPLGSLLATLKESQNQADSETSSDGSNMIISKSGNSHYHSMYQQGQGSSHQQNKHGNWSEKGPQFKNSTLTPSSTNNGESGSNFQMGGSGGADNNSIYSEGNKNNLGTSLQKGNSGDFGNSMLQGGAAGSVDAASYRSGSGSSGASMLKSNGEMQNLVVNNGSQTESSADEASSKAKKNVTPEEQYGPKAYCMALYSDNWCGYLIITTEAELDFSTVDIIFTEWIKTQFDNLQQVDEYDYFELDHTDYNMIQDIIVNADYHEAASVNDYNLNISFFQVEPKDMAIELNEDQNLIKIITDDVPAGLPLDFSLHLHLPENKKYILYTQANRPLSPEQKNRLITNKISTLFTSLDFEKEYKKFLAEKNVKILYESLHKKLKSV